MPARPKGAGADVPMCGCANVRMPARTKGAGADVRVSKFSIWEKVKIA
jgi:hypothetical protein